MGKTPLDPRVITAFRFLSSEEMGYLQTLLEIAEFDSHQIIIDEGGVSAHVYFIESGTVNVSVNKLNNTNAYISLLGQGECFGESGIFPKMKRSATITATEPLRCYRIHRKNLLHFISQHPSAGIKILMMIIYGLLKKIRNLNQELAFEREDDLGQDLIDSLVEDFMKDLQD